MDIFSPVYLSQVYLRIILNQLRSSPYRPIDMTYLSILINGDRLFTW